MLSRFLIANPRKSSIAVQYRKILPLSVVFYFLPALTPNLSNIVAD